MDQELKPVATDETLKEIVEVLKASNLRAGAMKEILQEICQKMDENTGGINDTNNAELFVIPINFVDGEPAQGSTIPGTYSLGSNVAFADIYAAYTAGKILVMRITDTTNNKDYFNASIVYQSGNPIEGFYCASMAAANPSNRNIGITIGANSSVFSFSIANPTAAGYVSCDVTINGTQYTTVDAALNALAALHNT